MDQTVFMDITREAVWVALEVSLPLLGIALVVGVAVSLLQALTQVQEMTLTFVPKMIAMLVGLVIFMPFMLGTLTHFTRALAERIVQGG